MPKIIPKEPTEDINKAFEKKENEKLLLKRKQDFIVESIEEIMDDPQSLFKETKTALIVENVTFKKVSISLEIDNDKKLVIKTTSIVDGKKFIKSKTFKP